MSSSETQKPTSTLISVIIPAYNVAEKLPETLDSLASQSAKDDPRFEFIIVDDGSRDNTLEVAKSYAASDPRFRVIHQENRGCGPARNNGIEAARGTWIGFLDGDDILMPGTLEKVLKLGENPKVDWIFGNYVEFTDHRDGAPAPKTPDGMTPRIPELPETGTTMPAFEWMKDSIRRHHWVHYCWIQFARRSWVNERKLRFPPRNIFHQDVVWTADLAVENPLMVFSRDIFVAYRVWSASVSNSKKPRVGKRHGYSYMHIIRSLVRMAAKLRPEHPDVADALIDHCAFETRHFYGILKHRVAPADRKLMAKVWCPEYTPALFWQGLPKTGSGIWFAIKFGLTLFKYRHC